VILGLIIERLTKNNLDSKINKRILGSLNLLSTGFKFDGSFSKSHMN